MNFKEAVDAVISITSRPDKKAATERAVNARLSMLSATNDLARDLQERVIAIPSSSYAFSLALSEFSRFRKFKCLKPAGRNVYLSPLAPDKIFCKGVELLDTYYVAGDQVNGKLKVADSSLLVSWYSYPPILTGVLTHWLLEAAPYVVIDGAAANIFRDIGDDASARIHEEQFRTGSSLVAHDLKSGAAHG